MTVISFLSFQNFFMQMQANTHLESLPIINRRHGSCTHCSAPCFVQVTMYQKSCHSCAWSFLGLFDSCRVLRNLLGGEDLLSPSSVVKRSRRWREHLRGWAWGWGQKEGSEGRYAKNPHPFSSSPSQIVLILIWQDPVAQSTLRR